MALESLLRLAWQADRDGRANRRDALLTLAVAEAPTEAPWSERCRLRLARSRPDHPFATFPSLAAALADSRVARGLRKLRDSYPLSRVRSLLALDAIRRGPFTGHEPSMSVVLADLFPTHGTRRSSRPLPPLAIPPARRDFANEAAPGPATTAARRRFDFEILLAIAMLVQGKRDDSGMEGRAA